MFSHTMMHTIAITLLAFCSFIYGQEKQKIAFVFLGEEPKKGIFKPLSSQMQMATMKKYVAEERTAEFRKLAEEGNEAYKAVSQWGVKYIIIIEMSEAIEGYYLDAKMMDVGNYEIVKMSSTESKFENSKDVSDVAQKIIAGLLDLSENSNSSASSNISYEFFIDPRDNQRYETINPWQILGVMIGGDYFGNSEGLLPSDNYKECDVDYHDSSRGTKRLVYTNAGLVYYTANHYESFTSIYEQ